MKTLKLVFLLLLIKVVSVASEPVSDYMKIPKSSALHLKSKYNSGFNVFNYSIRVVGGDTSYYCSPYFLTFFKEDFDTIKSTGWTGWQDTEYFTASDFIPTECVGCDRP